LLFLLPALALLALVSVYPLLYVGWLSLHRKMLLFDINAFVGLGNFLQALKDPRLQNSCFLTFYFTLASVSAELILGLLVALTLDATKKLQAVLRTVVLAPWAIPTVVAARLWEWMYNVDYGVINHLLDSKINWLGSPFLALHAAILADVWKTTPFAAILLFAALQTLPKELYLAARLDGAGGSGASPGRRRRPAARVAAPLRRRRCDRRPGPRRAGGRAGRRARRSRRPIRVGRLHAPRREVAGDGRSFGGRLRRGVPQRPR